MNALVRVSLFLIGHFLVVSLTFADNNLNTATVNCEGTLSKPVLTEFKLALQQNAINEQQQCEWAGALEKLINLPRVNTDILSYEGGFRLSSGRFGESKYATLNYSFGVFTYDPQRDSIYIIGNPKLNAIAEFPLPEIRNTTDISQLAIAEKPIQSFTAFHKTDRVNTGINNYFRPTGMAKIDNSLMLNYINWYDAKGNETDTSIMFWNSEDLPKSKVFGPYQLEGAAHAAGWISEVPYNLQSLLGGTHLAGSQPFASIISRRSVGPSAFVFDARRSVIYAPSGAIPTIPLLDFPLQKLLRDRSIYPNVTSADDILYNRDGRNKLWTVLSSAAYGFIIPGTRTYLTVGFSGGHKSSAGYKIMQNNGRKCGGPCAKDAKDMYPYYWAWDVKDLISVRMGLMQPHDVAPYDYGAFPIPNGIEGVGIANGSFDSHNNRLFISIRNADQVLPYKKTPLFLVYKVLNNN